MTDGSEGLKLRVRGGGLALHPCSTVTQCIAGSHKGYYPLPRVVLSINPTDAGASQGLRVSQPFLSIGCKKYYIGNIQGIQVFTPSAKIKERDSRSKSEGSCIEISL